MCRSGGEVGHALIYDENVDTRDGLEYVFAFYLGLLYYSMYNLLNDGYGKVIF